MLHEMALFNSLESQPYKHWHTNPEWGLDPETYSAWDALEHSCGALLKLSLLSHTSVRHSWYTKPLGIPEDFGNMWDEMTWSRLPLSLGRWHRWDIRGSWICDKHRPESADNLVMLCQTVSFLAFGCYLLNDANAGFFPVSVSIY